MSIASSDRAVFLAGLIEQRGIPLGATWRDAFAGQPIRVHFWLEHSGLDTLGEILRALGSDNKNSALGTHVTRTAIAELWEAFELLAGPAVTHFDSAVVAPASAEAFFSNLPRKSVWVKQSLSAYMLARIRAAGVDPDQPWENVMPAVSGRVHRALRGFSTLRDVVIVATDGHYQLQKLHNFGRGSLRELWALLEALALYGMDSVCGTSPDAPLTTIDELVTWVLESASERDRRLLIRRYLEGAALKELGQEEDVSGNTVRTWVCRALRSARIRVGDVARELIAPLIEAMAESGGVLHRDQARKFASTDDLRRVCLAAEIAGLDLRIQRDESLQLVEPEGTSSKSKVLAFRRRPL